MTGEKGDSNEERLILAFFMLAIVLLQTLAMHWHWRRCASQTGQENTALHGPTSPSRVPTVHTACRILKPLRPSHSLSGFLGCLQNHKAYLSLGVSFPKDTYPPKISLIQITVWANTIPASAVSHWEQDSWTALKGLHIFSHGKC